MSGKYGVITEQGYPAGQFGFDKVKHEDQKKLEESAKKETGKSSDK